MKNPIIDLSWNLAIVAFLLGCVVSPPCRAQANVGHNLGPDAAVEATGYEDCVHSGGLYRGTIKICGWVALVSGSTARLPGFTGLYVDGIAYRGLIGGLIDGVSRPDVQDYFATQGITAPGNLGYASTWDSTTVVDGVHRLSILVSVPLDDHTAYREVFSVVVVTRNNVGRSHTSSSVGVYRSGSFGITYGLSPGISDVAIPFGVPGDIPLAGDWYGNGSTGIGLFREGVFYLRASLSEGPPDWVVPFGNPGDLPVVGDWNGDGISEIGVYSNGIFSLRMSLAPDAQAVRIPYGASGDIPVAGDWTGDGISKIGVYRQGVFLLRKSLTSGIADLEIPYGVPGDIPVVGDWIGSGITTIGIYRDAAFYLSTSLTSGVADLQINYGVQGDTPVIGNWSPQWRPINNGLELGTPGTNVRALAIDPDQASTLYATSITSVGYWVSSGHPNVLMSTVFKSTDSGTNWIPAATIQNDWITKLFAQRNPSTLYFNTAQFNNATATIFKSTDGASTWEPLSAMPEGFLLGVDPANSSTLYAVKQGDPRIYKSTDGGTTWTQIGPVKGASSFATALAIDPQNSNVLYAAASEWRSVYGFPYTSSLGVFKSVDGGFNWISVNSNITPSFLTIDPRHSETLYALAGTIYKSTDGGTTWTAVNNGLPASITPQSQFVSLINGAATLLVIDPKNTEVLYLGLRSGAVFRTLDGGNSWTPINAGLSGCPIDSLAIDPQNPARLYKACYEGIYTISLTH